MELKIQFQAFINLSDLLQYADVFSPLSNREKQAINAMASHYVNIQMDGEYKKYNLGDFINYLDGDFLKSCAEIYNLKKNGVEKVKLWRDNIKESKDLMGIDLVLDYNGSGKETTSKETLAFLPE